MNVIEVAQALIRFPSITPQNEGCLEWISDFLTPLGFQCTRIDQEGVSNLYARIGTSSPHICFAGHIDVVPIQAGWSYPPFGGVIYNNQLIGRGISDMKGAIAAMLCAARDVIAQQPLNSSISFLLTSDEEGDARFGTCIVVDWLKEKGESIDFAIVGEPTNPTHMGQMAKVGRRGSLNFEVVAKGKSGHVAYPEFHDNPLSHLIPALNRLQTEILDEGCPYFEPSRLQVVSVTCPHQASNLIAPEARAWVNIRLNPMWTTEKLLHHIRSLIETDHISIIERSRSESFMGADQVLMDKMKKVLGEDIELSTSGGISDARFIRELCPVMEYGLLSNQAHQIDESVSLDDLINLKTVYQRVLLST